MQGDTTQSGRIRNVDVFATILNNVTCDNHSWEVTVDLNLMELRE